MQITSLILSLFFAGVFIFTTVIRKPPARTKIEDRIGEVYGHMQSGTSNDPTVPPRPFVQIATVTEAKGDAILLDTYYLHADGVVVHGKHWRRANDVPNSVETEITPGK